MLFLTLKLLNGWENATLAMTCTHYSCFLNAKSFTDFASSCVTYSNKLYMILKSCSKAVKSLQTVVKTVLWMQNTGVNRNPLTSKSYYIVSTSLENSWQCQRHR